MRKLFLPLLLFLTPLAAFAQSAIWQDVKPSSISLKGRLTEAPRSARVVQVNQPALLAVLARAPMEFTKAAKATTVVLEIPRPDGKMARFRIEESPMISGAAAKERPDWKTYSGRGMDDPTAVGRFSMSKEGFRGYVMGRDGTYYVDPYASQDALNYVVYFKHDLGGDRGSFHCGLDRYIAEREAGQPGPVASHGVPPAFSTGASIRTYRLAIATTGEYTVVRGGQGPALTDVMNAVNRINTVYRRDAAISFTLVSGTNTIFPDPNTDPYDNTDDGAQLGINQTQLDMIIGFANYDIGHLFGTGGGGVASSPVVCSPQKAEGYSARGPNSTGDPFWVDYVAHEMGHQFSAQHTYNNLEAAGQGCDTRSAADAYEPASGATIMAYVGVCAQRNLQTFSIDNFHIRSMTQILNEVVAGSARDCGTPTATGNTVPTVNPGANFTVPRLTPFTLTATGMDADAGDTLTYSWEEYDLGPASGPAGTPAGTFDVDTDGLLRPLFRALSPTASRSRTFPRLPYILSNANMPPLTYTGTSPTGEVCPPGDTCVTGENLPAVARTMNFRVAVRDGNGGVADAGMQVTVDGNSGPFVVTSPNTAVTATGGTPYTVTWNVANTFAVPINVANVQISLSTDGGATFPTVLSASTPNDGSESITIPNVNTTTARIKVEAIGNIFFDISDANFTIGGGGPTPTPSKLANISTRLRVEGFDNVPIAGFIVTGTANKRVIVRALGPSLNVGGVPVAGRVADTTLELVGPGGTIMTNDNWRVGGQEAEIIASTVPPPNDLESAIIADLPASAGGTAYTAVVRGKNGAVGVGQVEVYDLANAVDSQLANISTRGLVQTGDDVMIGGIILLGPNPRRVIVRAIGPSLSVGGMPLPGRLMDTILEIRDANGMAEGMNDNWRSDQEAEIIATMVPPTNDLESAVVATLPASAGGTSHTAVVRGKNNAVGVGLVEVFGLNN